MKKIIQTCLSFFLLCIPVIAQDWEKHTQSVLAKPSLIRYHLFDGSRTSQNLATSPDVANSDLFYQTQYTFETIAGPYEGTKAIRLDAGWFEGPILLLEKAFCIEMRVRLLRAGTEKGNNNSDNGTLFGLGNGYDNGIRLTTDCPRQALTFSIGRPASPYSRNSYANHSVPYGTWMHVATVWDGKTMRIYVDGMLYAITDFDGVLTEPCWGFRIGFNDAGVGSIKMDVAEVAVYREALAPEEILAHALLQPEFSGKPAALIQKIIEAVFQKEFSVADEKIDELLLIEMPIEYRFAVRKFQAELAAMSGKLSQMIRLSASLLKEPNLPPNLAESLLRRLIPTDTLNPLAVASSFVYRQMLDDPSLNLTDWQRFAIEKNYAQALFVESMTHLAGTPAMKPEYRLNALADREREFNRADLARQYLSAEFTELYKQHREKTEAVVPMKLTEPDGSEVVEEEIQLPHFFYVAPNGKAENPGTDEEPFGSLTHARNAIRKLKIDGQYPSNGVCVFIHGGIYPVSETFVLESQDTGTEIAPIIYQRLFYEGNERNTKYTAPIFTGGVSVSNFTKVNDANVLKRLPEESRDKILVASIPGNVKFPPAAPRGYGRNGLNAAPAVELFVNDKPMQIARYPNAPKPGAADMLKESEKTFIRTGKVHRGNAHTGENYEAGIEFNTRPSNQPGIFEYSDLRHERWTEAKDAMLYGYWEYLWAPSGCLVEKIDTSSKQVILASNAPYGFRENKPYYAFNLLEEIDEPGEWYLDRETNKLYIYPPERVDINGAKVRLSCFPKEFIVAKDVSHVSLHGLHFEEGTGNAIRVEGGENFNVIGCTVKRFGNWGLGLSGKNHNVIGCDFVALGGGGIKLSGGDIRTLTPGNCFVENTFVNDFSRIDRCYAPAVHIDGVGNTLRFNLFCDSPGHAICIGGMEHLVEFNEVHSIVYESDDQAGIDIYGNPYIRGMVFRYNYWHHNNSGRECGSAGIRLDDMISSVLIYGNVFLRTSGSNFGGVQIHGGKDNIVDGNIMIDCKYAVSCSPWGEKRWLENLESGFGPRSRQWGFDPDSEVFRTKYPDYAELKMNADRNFVTRNAAIGCDSFSNNPVRNVMSGNAMLPWMPSLFSETQGMSFGGVERVPEDARAIRGRLTIPNDSPLYEFLDIPPIPMEHMGLYRDHIRKEIPKTEITPFFVLE